MSRSSRVVASAAAFAVMAASAAQADARERRDHGKRGAVAVNANKKRIVKRTMRGRVPRRPPVRQRGAGAPLARASAVGSYYRGRMHCHDDSNGLQYYILSDAPLVRAANTTSYVDRQWVYWRARILSAPPYQTIQPATPWTQWTWAYAADNAWTSVFYETNGVRLSTGTPSYWTWGPFMSNPNVMRLVENELWFYDSRGGWSYGGTFRSAPGTSAGTLNGAGYCVS